MRSVAHFAPVVLALGAAVTGCTNASHPGGSPAALKGPEKASAAGTVAAANQVVLEVPGMH